MGTTSKPVDDRKDNTNPNGLPLGITVAAFLGDEQVGLATLNQRAKLSKKGNVSYDAGINAGFGWTLPGVDAAESLRNLRFQAYAVDGSGQPVTETVVLERAGDDVHEANRSDGKVKVLTVFHAATIELPMAAGGVARYTVTARPETLISGPKAGVSTLAFQGVPVVSGSGQTHRGELVGFGR